MPADVKALKEFLLWCREQRIVLHELDWHGVRLSLNDPGASPQEAPRVDTSDHDAMEMLKQYAMPAYLAMVQTQSHSKEPKSDG